jgi:hypothetical protein
MNSQYRMAGPDLTTITVPPEHRPLTCGFVAAIGWIPH